MRREPTPYTPTDAEWQALGARLFGLEEHEPMPRRVPGPPKITEQAARSSRV